MTDIDLTRLSEATLLNIVKDILSKPGGPTEQDLAELEAINAELARRDILNNS